VPSEATVTSKGQITIPAQLRARLNLKDGDKVEFYADHEGRIMMRPRNRSPAAFLGAACARPQHRQRRRSDCQSHCRAGRTISPPQDQGWMIGLDTNILLRSATQDDPVQSPISRPLIGSLDDANPGYVNTVLLAEFVWNLRTRVKVRPRSDPNGNRGIAPECRFRHLRPRCHQPRAIARCHDESLEFPMP
jgi:AbrB family looped-hinge helix DNA binding protein